MENQKRVIALGFFDGIHIGHAALMRRTVARAGEMGAIPTVMSFDVHHARARHGSPAHQQRPWP